MNRKGQTLIIFVMLIPIFVLVAAFVVDIGMMTYQYNHYRNIVDEGIKEYFDGGIEKLQKVLELNDIKKEEYKVEYDDEKVEVILNTKVDSIFGKIINWNEYEIVVQRIGTKQAENVLIEKKE